MKIDIIKCLEDNFSYLLINEKNSDACVVDPGEAKPVLKFIEENKINLKYIRVQNIFWLLEVNFLILIMN